jgi:hypothetical protein
VAENAHELYGTLQDVLENTNKNCFPRVAGDLNTAVNIVLGRNGESPVGVEGNC